MIKFLLVISILFFYGQIQAEEIRFGQNGQNGQNGHILSKDGRGRPFVSSCPLRFTPFCIATKYAKKGSK